MYALIGKRVTLECIAEGDPTPSVYWIEPSQPRRGDLAPDGLGYDVYEGSAVLDIASVGREDQGYYTCVATNSGGRTEDSLQLIGILLRTLCCYVPGVTRKEFRKPKFGICKVSKKHF